MRIAKYGLLGALLAGCGASAPPAQKPEPFAGLRVLRTTPAPAAFARFGVRPTVDTVAEPVSRVVATAESASFAAVRAALERGEMPDPDAVRVEEVVQAFTRPVAGEALGGFRVAAARFASPARPGYDVLALCVTTGEAAQDATVELAFDPAAVARYRLLGYEREAGESTGRATVPAGTARTLLYEVQVVGEAALATLRLADGPERLALRVARRPWGEAEGWARRAWVAAALAEKLRGGYWVRALPYERLAGLNAADDELGRLIGRARALDRRGDAFEAERPRASMDFDEVPLAGGSR